MTAENVELTLHQNEEFLTSEKRLFNRRGSNDQSDESESKTKVSKTQRLNAMAPIFVPKHMKELEDSRKRGQQRRVYSTKRACSYCKRKGFDSVSMSTHTLRNPQNSEIICPFLLKDICTVHQDSKDAHDRYECPLLVRTLSCNLNRVNSSF